ncbi:malate dehydrogenase-like [Pieris rapae]|uniref:malate dehydrogenase-like n=1 Tax=Pieris rapae TaxID=64459 RepID=UPI001E27C765|nr:malate dehydrogenase-like [Pieris rapae]
MFSRSLVAVKSYFSKSCILKEHRRNAQVSIIGAANGIGSNLALLLKRNNNITRLNLYDDSERVLSIGSDISALPGGPRVATYSGYSFLPASIRSSHLILMVSRIPRKPGYTRDQMLAANAPAVQRLCKTIAEINPDAVLAISTNPINSILPFASSLLFKYCAYDAAKIFGITQIDTARAKAYAAKTLNVNPRHLYVPVIGGHSDETIVPLFSNMTPTHYKLDSCQADTLTKLVKKSGMEVVRNKHGVDSSTLAMAWSINEFVENMVEALYGATTVVNTFTANPHFGTRFFSGPTKIGCYGIVETCGANFHMSEYERFILGNAITHLNKEVGLGEEYARMEAGKI